VGDSGQVVRIPPFPPDYRASGVLLHVTSLPSPYGIGDLGPAAFTWVDRLQEAGQCWWQALPLGPTGYGNSPYQSLSSFAGNGLLISPQFLIEDGLLRASDCAVQSISPNAVDYDSVIRFKHRLLEIAWDNFVGGARTDLRTAYEQFCHERAHWLEDYASFRALKLKYNGAYYLEWPAVLVERDPAALREARRELADVIDRVRFAQFLLLRQAQRLEEHARAKGLRLIGDLPFFVSPDSSDVWANPELFLLDDRRRPRFVAGVPPDYFSAEGQLWGNPVYDWDALRRTGYRWCIDRFRALLAHVDVIRLDHFRAFAAAWHVPAGASSARSGQWEPAPGAEFFSTVLKELGALPFIAEDLGLITQDVSALRDQFHIPGTKVLQFAFDGDSDNPYLPHNYVSNSVVYTGTHDNATTRGWYEGLPNATRRNLWSYLKQPEGDAAGAAPALMELAWSSAASLAIAPLQDALNLGSEARMNVPGRAEGNWSWRCTEEALSGQAFERLRTLTKAANRLPRTMRPDRLADVRLGGPVSSAGNGSRASPLGATVVDGGVNFSLFSRSAAGVDLLLFDRDDDARPARVIPIDPITNRTYHYWHVFVPDVRPGQIYGYRVQGPFDPASGMRFDPSKVLLDPYGRGVVVPKGYSRTAASQSGDNTATAMKSVVVDPGGYDWEGDTPLRVPSSRTIIYEMHVQGFTRHPSSGVAEETRGTFAGLIEKIPYLQELGITAVELLPVFQFDAQDSPPGRVNYWGYAPVSFFAPHRAYSSRQDPLGPLDEFRDMVKALHRAGLEVILDVVFNHTAEGDQAGPTLCFRGLDNATYYVLEGNRSRYANYSGTGNTLNANHPIVRRMIVDSLRYWVEEMHVDGFRFDLASILARDPSGHPMPSPPVLWDIESDPSLAGTKLIAEAWDAAGLYQVGSFIGDSWKEWNGRFRDDVRSFFRGEEGFVRRVADRVLGSPEIYAHKEREAEQSVNFVTCHDGFTLNDLVSYDRKHNEANGENNRDGADDNRSWNCGTEGPSDHPAIEKLRNRQVKNFLTVTMLSLGLPMISMGDEVRRTQHGNNNAYCQDNDTSWFDWTLLAKHGDVRRFVTLLTARRQLRDVEAEHGRMSLNQWLREANKAWHGVKPGQPDWSDSSHSLAFSAELRKEGILFYLILNAYWQPLDFELPPVDDAGETPWRRWIDTALDSPHDIVPWQTAQAIPGRTYRVEARSVVLVFGAVGGS
jgi:isoamylase